MEHTGRIITSAALIMVTVFGAFAFASLTPIKAMGFGLATAVFLDATLIRVVLVPATMRLMGKWNWWIPRWLDRIVPRVAIEEAPAPEPAMFDPHEQLNTEDSRRKWLIQPLHLTSAWFGPLPEPLAPASRGSRPRSAPSARSSLDRLRRRGLA